MKVYDENLGQEVEVKCASCPGYECYSPSHEAAIHPMHIGRVVVYEGWCCTRRQISGCPRKKRRRQRRY